MRTRTESRLITLPPTLEEVTAENILRYCQWQQQANILSRDIITPFREGAKNASIYNSHNTVSEEVKEPVFEQGDVTIRVVSKPPSSGMDWRQVYEGHLRFAEQLRVQREEGTAREGVFTDRETGEVYVELEVINDRHNSLTTTHRKESTAPRQSIEISGLEVNEDDSMRVFYSGRDYSQLSVNNAQAYIHAQHLLAEGKKRVEEDKDDTGEKIPRLYRLLRTDAVEAVGGRPEIKEYVAYGNEDLVFDVGVKPMSRASYDKIVSELFKPLGKRIATNSKIGQLVIVESALTNTELNLKLQDKGLYSHDFIARFKPRMSGREKPSILLAGYESALEEARHAHTGEYEEITIGLSLDSVVSRYLR